MNGNFVFPSKKIRGMTATMSIPIPLHMSPALRDLMISAYLLRGYYQPAGPLIQHPSSKGPVQDCPPHELPSSRGPDDLTEAPPQQPPLAYGRPLPPYQAPYYPSGYYAPPPPQPATTFHQHYHHHQELCYPPGYPPTPYRRYLSPGYHPPDIAYSSSSAPSSSNSEPPAQHMGVPGGSNSYPPPPPPSGYCAGYPPGPGPSCYSHPPQPPSRNLPYLDASYQSCPCPIQACPKNVHTGPLTGECKRPGALPLPPVALALPQEPPGAAGPPSPARGSAVPAANWPNTSPGLPPGPPVGLLAISETATAAPKKRRNSRESERPHKKRAKRSNENAGVDKKPPRKADPTILKDRNTEAEVVPEHGLTELKLVEQSTPIPVIPRDTIQEVIEAVVRGKSESPPLLQRVPSVLKSRKRRKQSPPPPTLQPAVPHPLPVSLPVQQHPVCEATPVPDLKPPRLAPVVAAEKNKKKPRPAKVPKTKSPVFSIKEVEVKEVLQPLPLSPVLTPVPTTPVKKARKSYAPSSAVSGAPRWSNGWNWDGLPFDAKVYLSNDAAPVMRRCYPAMRHSAGDIIQPRDCILLKAGPRKNDLPFVAKVSALWENPDDGEMMVSLLWYYRPEHTDQGRRLSDHPDEIFASRHKDVNSVACIEDKCFVLTYDEYCRYRKKVRAMESGIEEVCRVPKLEQYPWRHRQPPGVVAPDLIFFCRKVYDFRQKRLLKNPT